MHARSQTGVEGVRLRRRRRSHRKTRCSRRGRPPRRDIRRSGRTDQASCCCPLWACRRSFTRRRSRFSLRRFSASGARRFISARICSSSRWCSWVSLYANLFKASLQSRIERSMTGDGGLKGQHRDHRCGPTSRSKIQTSEGPGPQSQAKVRLARVKCCAKRKGARLTKPQDHANLWPMHALATHQRFRDHAGQLAARL